MNVDQIRSKLLPSSTKTQKERREYAQEPDPEAAESSGSWRRRSAVAAAALGLGMYLRRRRSRGETHSQTVEFSGGKKRGLGRRVASMVISTLAFALVRRFVRRFRSKR